MAETQTALWSRVLGDRPVVVAVDPCRTEVARVPRESGGVHLAPLPGFRH